MIDAQISRASLLIEQNRFKEASLVLKDVISQEPDNAYVLGMYGLVLLETEEIDKAEQVIDDAIALAPDYDYLFYLKARIALHQDNYNQAESSLQEALTLSPDDADYYALWSSIKLARKKYEEALNLADKALSLDSENLFALNIRSSALLKLNKKEESLNAIEGALKEDPNNAYTHANYGWGLLEQGNSQKALEHFKEALKNDPNSRYAQAGMLEALKAKYWIYRIFLRYALWMGNLTTQYQWGVIIGFYLLYRLLNSVSENNPALQPILTPVLFLMALIAFSTWVMTPLSNLFLRLNPYGKHLLDEKEIMSSNFVGISAMVFLFGLLTFFISANMNWLAVAVFGFTMMVPLGSMFAPTKYKNALLYYSIAMAVVGALSISITFLSDQLVNQFSMIYIFGFIAYQWIANFLMIQEDNI